MPIDPLVLAMMSNSGGGDNAAMMNPAYAAAIPRMQLAQQLMQEGTSAAPAYPLQGLARVLQSVAGGYMLNNAMKGLSAGAGQEAQALSQAFPANHPIQGMLKSSSPLVQYQGVQAAKAAMAQLGGLYADKGIGTGPNGEPAAAPGYGAAQGTVQGQTAAASAPGEATKAATIGMAQLPAEITKSLAAAGLAVNPQGQIVPMPGYVASSSAVKGAQSAAEAQGQVGPHNQEKAFSGNVDQLNRQRQADYEYFLKYGSWPQNERWFGGAAGGGAAPQPALPNAPSAAGGAMPGASGAPGGVTEAKPVSGPTPKVQPEMPAPQTITPPSAPAPTGQGTPQASIEVPGKQPGVTEPLITPKGTAIPPVSAQPRGQGSAGLDSQNAISQEMDKNFASVRGGFEGTENRLMALGKALQDVQSGGYNERKADIANNLRGVGLGSIADMVMSGKDTSAVQKAIGLQTLDVLGQLKQINSGTGGRILNSEFQNMLNRQYGPDLSPQANFDLITQALGGVYQTRNMIDDWNSAKNIGWRDANAFQSAYLGQPQNKMDNMIDYAKSALGPLKGMDNAPSQSVYQPGMQTATNPKTGERRYWDGKEWLPLKQ